jgi:hypothetical protein
MPPGRFGVLYIDGMGNELPILQTRSGERGRSPLYVGCSVLLCWAGVQRIAFGQVGR